MPADQLPILMDSTTQTAVERRKLMNRGGVYFASTQQFLTDLLKDTVDARRILGLLVINADQVSDNCREALAIRVYKEKNPGGFVKALSENPEALSTGFGKLEQTMRNLFVKKVSLWPRYQEAVKKELDSPSSLQGCLFEETVALSPSMQRVQRALFSCLDAALTEIQACTHCDVNELTRNAAIFDSFDSTVLKRLGDGFAAKARVRSALRDIKSQRKLIALLLRHDAVSFYDFLDTLSHAAIREGRKDDWILGHKGRAVLAAAKDRVYRVSTVTISLSEWKKRQALSGLGGWKNRKGAICVEEWVAGGKSVNLHTLDLVLEHNPKWERLCAILKEEADAAGPILISVKDEKTCPNLQKLLEEGAAGMLQSRARELFEKSSYRTEKLRQSILERYKPLWCKEVAEGCVFPKVTEDTVCEDASGLLNDEEIMLTSLEAPAFSSSSSLSHARKENISESNPCTVDSEWYFSQEFAGKSKEEREFILVGDLPAISFTPDAHTLPINVAIEQRLLWKQLAEFARSKRVLAKSDSEYFLQLEEKKILESVGWEEWREEDEVVLAVEEKEKEAEMNSVGGEEDVEPVGSRKSSSATVEGAGMKRERLMDSVYDPQGSTVCDSKDKSADQEVIVMEEKTSSKRRVSSSGTLEERPHMDPTARMGHWIPAPDLSSTASNAPYLQKSVVVIFPSSKISLSPTFLRDLNPSVVIMYDPDVGFTRCFELHAATLPPLTRLPTYLLSYSASIENYKFELIMNREKNSFAALISTKSTMAPPVPFQPAVYGAERGERASGGAGLNGLGVDSWGITRDGGFKSGGSGGGKLVQGGGGRSGGNLEKLPVVLDIREMKAKLPSLLHASGFILLPCTLEVGDYVLSPTVCVERKAIPDLVNSLATGRLYTQANHMCRHYKTPVLLIESDNEKSPWLFEGRSEESGFRSAMTVDFKDPRCKLTVLLMGFPSLRLVWSSSPHHTVDLFKMLREGHPFPDQEVAVSLRTDEEGGVGAAGNPSEFVKNTAAAAAAAAAATTIHENYAAIDILKKLPGVTTPMIKPLTLAYPSLAALARAPLEGLVKVLGAVKGSQLHAFLHKRPPTQ